tara:strand:+ start:6157 stop:7707 length:1551 start_codon:yes stop_codon:yes gene_type:complete
MFTGWIESYIELLSPFLAILLSAVVFKTYRSKHFENHYLIPKSILRGVSTSVWLNFLRGIWQSLRTQSLHSLLSTYFSLGGAGYVKVEQILAIFLGAEFTLMLVGILQSLIIIFRAEMLVFIIFLSLGFLSFLFFRSKKTFYAFVFISLFYYLQTYFSYLDVYGILYQQWDVYSFFVPIVFFFLFPSSLLLVFFCLYILLNNYESPQVLNFLSMLVPVSLLLLSFRAWFLQRRAPTRILRTLMGCTLLVLLQLVFIALVGFFAPYYVGFIIAVFISLLLLKKIIPLLSKLQPDRRYKEANALISYQLGLENIANLQMDVMLQEVRKKSALVFSMLEILYEDLKEGSIKVATEKRIHKYEKITDSIQEEIEEFSSQIMKLPLSNYDSKRMRALLKIVKDLESLADATAGLYKHLLTSKVAENQLRQEKFLSLFTKSFLLYEKVFEDLNEKPFFVSNKQIFKRSLKLSDELSRYHDYIENGIAKDEKQEVIFYMDSYYLIRKMKSHISNIFQAQQGIH